MAQQTTNTGVPSKAAWRAMIARCHNPTSASYSLYGARGIRVCLRWRTSYEAFVADVGPKPGAGYSLDRVRNNGHYSPANVRWATRSEQALNTRRNRRLTYQGRTQPLSVWSQELGINYNRLVGRLRMGWSVSRALGSPGDCREKA